MRRTINDRQRRHALADASITATTPVTQPGPITPEAREFLHRHGDPHGWASADWKTFIELGGAS